MAKTAMKETDEVETVAKPDFERAIRVMKNDIKPAEEQNAESRGDLSAAWKEIEACHVHKGAAKIFRTQVLEASADKKDDFLRSLRGLMLAAGLGISRDLVDIAEGANPVADVIPVEGDPIADRDAEFDAAAPDLSRQATKKTATHGSDLSGGATAKPKPAPKRAPPKLVAVGGATAPLGTDLESVLD